MNNAIRNVKNLIDDFVDEKENGFYASVCDLYYTSLVNSFADVVEECCEVVIYGRKYAMNAKQLYNYDPYLAVEAWAKLVDDQFGDFPSWAEQFIEDDDLEVFAKEFQQWLAKQDSEEAANVAVAFMSGDIDLDEIIVDWLYDRLRGEDWDYPA